MCREHEPGDKDIQPILVLADGKLYYVSLTPEKYLLPYVFLSPHFRKRVKESKKKNRMRETFFTGQRPTFLHLSIMCIDKTPSSSTVPCTPVYGRLFLVRILSTLVFYTAFLAFIFFFPFLYFPLTGKRKQSKQPERKIKQ